AKDRDGERQKADRKDHLAKMESRGGGYVEIKIGMMHVMKSPEERHHVVGPVPPPVGVIHQQKRRDGSSPCWKRKPVQQTDMSILRPDRYRDRNWQHGQTDDRESRNREHKIAHQSVQHAKMLATQRKTPLQQEQCEKYTSEQWPADVIHQRNFWHWIGSSRWRGRRPACRYSQPRTISAIFFCSGSRVGCT